MGGAEGTSKSMAFAKWPIRVKVAKASDAVVAADMVEEEVGGYLVSCMSLTGAMYQ